MSTSDWTSWTSATCCGEADDNAASADPIDRLHAAVTVARRTAALGDELIDHYVDAARSAGCSWAQIGDGWA